MNDKIGREGYEEFGGEQVSVIIDQGEWNLQIVGYQNCNNIGLAESMLRTDKLSLTLTMWFANLLKSNKSWQRDLMDGDRSHFHVHPSSFKVTRNVVSRAICASSSDIEVPK